ncbi:MAG: dihydroxy-acid dehydratase [Betaproteobacteria bacterium]|nr:MAG: dihydroxy-acid dehydratase [Betaproteobacteria bacterium]
MKRKKSPEELRSHRWLGPADLRSFGHRSRALQMGFAREDYQGKPVIAILNTWSDVSHCHTHFRERVEDVKRGVWQAGGFPVEIPAISLAEVLQKPTTMMYRNLLAMETEELLRSYPADGCVLMGGCDKTGPGLMMGAISMDLPSIFVPAGPMLRGNWQGKILGSGSDAWKYWDELRTGNINEQDWREIEEGIARSPGTCMTMGTASTMTSVIETLGFSLPNASSIPAPDSNHPRMASLTGRRIVDMVWEDLKPSDILSERSFDNAIKVLMALGGSTNGLIHVIALAGRAGIKIELERFEEIGREAPYLVNMRPSGRYLMEDFYYAGGLVGLLEGMRSLLDVNVLTCTGKTLGENIAGAKIHNKDVIHTPDDPMQAEGGLIVLRGNLAPDGAVIKSTAADPKLLKHSGRAMVFDDYNDMAAKLEDPDLDVDADSVLILRNSGPQGGPGMPEWGMLPIPKKLLKQGVRDMVRISDARMSGTSYGTCVLHVAPESWIGGPLALVKTGDTVELDVPGRKLNLKVSDEELEQRRAAWKPKSRKFERGYGKLFSEHIRQANEGCDFDFLEGTAQTPEPEIH